MDKEVVSGLKSSSKRVGRLYPVLLDKHGNVIDGLHRLASDSSWPKIKLDHIESKEDRLIARLVANVCRRNVSAEEKREMLRELGELYVESGIKPGAKLANKISEKTGMSYRWVMKYLPESLKERPGIGGPTPRFGLAKARNDNAVAHRATFQMEFLLFKPTERILTVKKYANVNFVQVMLDKRFYANIERVAEHLGITPEVIINNVLVWAIKKLMDDLSPKQLTATAQ
ncbi:MAG: hypothetical protein QXX79_00175 [Candidatus Bathyarchaeia archaeon]